MHRSSCREQKKEREINKEVDGGWEPKNERMSTRALKKDFTRKFLLVICSCYFENSY